MRKTLLIGLLIGFSLGLQAQTPETPREVWCYLASVQVKNARDYQKACQYLHNIFPSAQSVNKLDITRKLYLNKMRGCLKRGSNWVKLPPKNRVDLAQDAVAYTNKFIKWKEGMRNSQPSFAQLGDLGSSVTCSAVELKYVSLGAHSRDVNYMYVDCMADQGKRSEEKFWCVLEFLAAMAECDEVYSTYK